MSIATATFAFDLTPGMTILINGSEAVTVAEVTRRDSRWITNGVVHFTGTNGHRYGLNRLDLLRFAALPLAEARALMDEAYAVKGLAADQLKRSRTAFNAASRALAHAEAAFRTAEAAAAATAL